MKIIIFLLPVISLAALPKGSVVISGKAEITPAKIEAEDRTVIHWSDFSIEEGERFEFSLPNSDSAVLNRVVEMVPSRLMGLLESNGRVILINPQGILVGKSGLINTGAFIASSLDLLDRTFVERGFLEGTSNARGSVINLGSIASREVCLAGFTVENEGKIEADRAALAGTTGIGMQLNPLKIQTWDSQTIENLPTLLQKGFILADDVLCLAGSIDMPGEIEGKEVRIGGDFRGGNEMWKNARIVRIDGSIRADGDQGGKVIAWSDGALGFYGSISARGIEEGGFAEVSAKNYLEYRGLADLRSERGLSGTLLIDPPDISINTNPNSPGVVAGVVYTIPALAAVDINNGNLSSQLDLSNVLISTNTAGGGTGHISVDAPINWTLMPNTLTLETTGTSGSIFVNDLISSSTGGNVVLNSGADISVTGPAAEIDLDTGSGSISMSAVGSILIESGLVNSLLVGSGKISLIADGSIFIGGSVRATLTDLNLAIPQITVIADADSDGIGDVQIGTATMPNLAELKTFQGDIFVQGYNVGLGNPLSPFASNLDAGTGLVYGGVVVNAYHDFNMLGGLGASALNWRGADAIISVRHDANLVGGNMPSAYGLMQGGGGITVLAVGNDLLIRGGTSTDTDAGIDGIAFGSSDVSVLVGRDLRFEAQPGSPLMTESAIAGLDNTMIRVGRNLFVQGGFDPTNLSVLLSANPNSITSIFAGGNMTFQNEVTEVLFQITPFFNHDSTDLRAGGDIRIGATIDKTGAGGYIHIESDAAFANLWTATPNSVAPTNGNPAVLAGTPLASPLPIASDGIGAVIVDTGSFGAAAWSTMSGGISILSRDAGTNGAAADFINGPLANQAGIATTSGDIQINGFRNILIDPPLITTGDVFIRAMNDLTVEMPISARNITLVIDEQGPNGTIGGLWDSLGGSFSLLPGVSLTSTGTLQIFTARQNNNTISGLLNGQPFIAGPPFLDTETERWCVFFGGPGSGFAGPLYTVFYKECLQQITAQAETINVEFLAGLHPYDESPGWWQRFSLADGLNYEPYAATGMRKYPSEERYFLTRRKLKFFNLPKDYTALLHSEF